MKKNNRLDDLIIRHAIDKNDLTEAEKTFLYENRESGNSISLLEKDLATLGEMAASFAPKPGRPVELQSKKPVWWGYMQSAMAMCMAFLIVAVVIPRIYKPEDIGEPVNLAVIYTEIERDQQFMTEVEALVDSAVYSDIYPDVDPDDSYYDFSDEFMETVVPI